MLTEQLSLPLGALRNRARLLVVRSFFEYQKAAGVIPLNSALTKLVSPPELPSEPAGRALSAREVRYLLSGADREESEGAKD